MRLAQQDPGMATMMQTMHDPTYRARLESKMNTLKQDPELASVMQELEAGGPAAMMKCALPPRCFNPACTCLAPRSEHLSPLGSNSEHPCAIPASNHGLLPRVRLLVHAALPRTDHAVMPPARPLWCQVVACMRCCGIPWPACAAAAACGSQWE